jgi:hypothetical protein
MNNLGPTHGLHARLLLVPTARLTLATAGLSVSYLRLTAPVSRSQECSSARSCEAEGYIAASPRSYFYSC